MITLSVEKRDPSAASAQSLRHAGRLPGVVYGPHHESTPIALDSQAFEKVLREAGESTALALQGLGEPVTTLIHEVDLDPLTHRPRHVDFYAVTKGEKVQVAIPLTFIGESEAVKLGANLVKVMHEIEVEADPLNLPHEITVDISRLNAVGDQIHVSDLVFPSGVTAIPESEEVVALTQEVKEEVVEEAPAADLESIEVEKKGKEEAAEGAEGAEAAAE